jgi:serine protease
MTPLYRRDQGYLDAIGVDDIPTSGPWFGLGLAVVDVGWNLDHEALRHIGRPRLFPMTMMEVPADTHGTAVLGVVVGGAKIQGIAAGATVKALVFPTRGPTSVAEQLLEVIDAKSNNALQYGDILLIEIEQEDGHGVPEGLPLEVQPDVFEVIQLAVSRGIVVIEAAGNGAKQGSVRVGWDLDEIARDGQHAPAWRQKSGRDGAIPSSGAILVSGCKPFRQSATEPYEVDPRLNHGSMVGCYGFGSTVLTSGGYFPPPGRDPSPNRDDPNVWYDCGFGMTSAAAAMVAGVALAIQRMAHEELGHPLSPTQLQAVLRDPRGGTSVQRNGRRVGIVPHLPRIRDLLRQLSAGHA